MIDSTNTNVEIALKLAEELTAIAPCYYVTGNHEAWIENYKGIIEYSDSFVLLQGKTCQICISGKRLSIDYYTNEDMKISGQIESVRYE